jgi:hypothetical protein
MNKTMIHHNLITIYFRNDEVISGGRTYICDPPAMINSCIGKEITNTKYWRLKPMTTDEKLAELHLLRTKGMQDHELRNAIVTPEGWDENFLKAVKKELLNRQIQ